jgi:curved DNA-binding protein CbpA
MENHEDKEIKNYYKVLNIGTGATNKEILEGYIQVSEKLNLESAILGGFTGNLKYQVELYNTAYNTLISPELRREYDLKLKERERKFIDKISQKMQKSRVEEEISEKKIFRGKEEKLFHDGKNFLLQKKLDDAIEIFRELIKVNHKNAVYHSYLGLSMLEKGWDGYASAEFKIALHYDKHDPVALKHFKKPLKKDPPLSKRPANKGFITRITNAFNRIFRRNLQKI